VLVVTDPGIVRAGHALRAVQYLKDSGLSVVVFDQVRENPTTEDVEACLAVARTGRVDLIIGLGGGSSIDTAKACNILLTNGGRMQDYRGTGRVTRPLFPLVAVPTATGTGSACQSFAIIADPHTHLQDGLWGPGVDSPNRVAGPHSHSVPAARGDRGHGNRCPGARHRGRGDARGEPGFLAVRRGSSSSPSPAREASEALIDSTSAPSAAGVKERLG